MPSAPIDTDQLTACSMHMPAVKSNFHLARLLDCPCIVLIAFGSPLRSNTSSGWQRRLCSSSNNSSSSFSRTRSTPWTRLRASEAGCARSGPRRGVTVRTLLLRIDQAGCGMESQRWSRRWCPQQGTIATSCLVAATYAAGQIGTRQASRCSIRAGDQHGQHGGAAACGAA